ncbi:MAG: flagellin [Azospirillaceae bacterium]|nr:flagellin [Azospirillaceae bacterium]
MSSTNGTASGLPSSYTSASSSYADVCSYFSTVSNYYAGATDGVESSVQVTSTTSVTYGTSADNTSLQTVLRAIYAAANLQPTTANASSGTNKSEFQNYLSDINNDLTTGMSGGTITNAATNPSSGSTNTVVGLNTVQGIQGDVYTNLTDIATQNSTTQSYLSTNLSNIQDADLTAVSTQIINLQTQIQASFKAISIISSLSLASYI